jgi:hypothetical protein
MKMTMMRKRRKTRRVRRGTSRRETLTVSAIAIKMMMNHLMKMKKERRTWTSQSRKGG